MGRKMMRRKGTWKPYPAEGKKNGEIQGGGESPKKKSPKTLTKRRGLILDPEEGRMRYPRKCGTEEGKIPRVIDGMGERREESMVRNSLHEEKGREAEDPGYLRDKVTGGKERKGTQRPRGGGWRT